MFSILKADLFYVTQHQETKSVDTKDILYISTDEYSHAAQFLFKNTKIYSVSGVCLAQYTLTKLMWFKIG